VSRSADRKPLRIATRKSALALWQARHVQSLLERAHDGLSVELLPMTTSGDVNLDGPLSQVGGKGLFVKELEQALLRGEADIAVHSMKDVPAQLPDGLVLDTVLEAEDPRDAFVSNRYGTLEELPAGARVGTSSLRRQCLLRHRRPDLEVGVLRGNVETRLRRLDEGRFDAVILACAGLRRLGLAERIRGALPVEQSLPAVGQGIIGIECRGSDAATRRWLAPLEHAPTRVRLTAERALNARVGGSCQTPLAAHAELQPEGRIRIRTALGMPDGSRLLQLEISGDAGDAQSLGEQLAQSLLDAGGAAILSLLQEHQPAT
jgi:hydroxymethylbilane synthase